ncbi:MAG TPA: hypothetical protein VFN67_34595, partial [Polyangiales bacterium]|nr:hypothetical protein [Polyangiales bacterium]
MHRFESFSHSRDDTRRILRDRLGRMLRPAHEPRVPARNLVCPVSDTELLELLVRVQVTYGDELDRVRAAYAEHAETHPGCPTFDDLIEDGWFGVTWGRVVSELRTRDAVRQQDEPLRAGLELILNARRIPTLAFGDVSDLSAAARAMVAELERRPEHFRLPARSPDWVAARLWERRPEVADTDALRWWVDRWRLLGAEPLGAPTTWWGESDARAWRQAAIDVLRADPGLTEWSREKTLLDAWLRHQRSRTPSPPLASTLVDRSVWLNDTHCDHWGRALELCGDTWVLLDMLCQDLVTHDAAMSGPPAAELFDLVVERPTLLVLLTTRLQQHPTLLADLLLHSATCALACTMIANWDTQPVAAWE